MTKYFMGFWAYAAAIALLCLAATGELHPQQPTTTDSEVLAFSRYKPNFFTFGDQKDQTLLQFSFKYALIKNHNLFLGYTQTSWWNLYNESSPFFLTHYNPEIFYLWDVKTGPLKSVTFGLYEHKSNGRDGAASRSMDSSYLQFTTIAWRFEWVNKFFMLYNLDTANNNLRDYIGWWRTGLSYKFDLMDELIEEAISVHAYAGGLGDNILTRGGLEVDVTFGVPFLGDKFAPMLTFQYFRGYGVNLFDYQIFQQTFRAGIVLYR